MFQKILVATDGSRLSLQAAEKALQLGKQFQSKVKIIFVIDQRVFFYPHDVIMLPPDNPYFRILEELQKGAATILQKIVEMAESLNIQIETEILEGAVVDEILKAVKKFKADLLVIGAHGKTGEQRGILGSTAQSLSLQVPCSLLIIRK